MKCDCSQCESNQSAKSIGFMRILVIVSLLAVFVIMTTGCSVKVQRLSSETAEENIVATKQLGEIIVKHGETLQVLAEDYRKRNPEPKK